MQLSCILKLDYVAEIMALSTIVSVLKNKRKSLTITIIAEVLLSVVYWVNTINVRFAVKVVFFI